jgi:hypothetical protein
METNASPAQATACPNYPLITETDVVAFVTEMAVRLGNEAANGYVSVGVTCVTNFGDARIEWTTYADGSSHIHRPTLAEAFAAQVSRVSPAMKADRMRREALQLIEKAEQLEAMAATVLPSDVAAEVMPEGRGLPGKSTNIHE